MAAVAPQLPHRQLDRPTIPHCLFPNVAQTIKLAENGYDEQWMAGHATWYGEPQGEGSSGGACGYSKLTGTPYGPKIAAGNAAILQDGLGCGQCYDVKCNPEPTRIVITDLCPGGTFCSKSEPAFDLSGAAITAMATPGKDGALRNIGLYDVLCKRVPCEYQNQSIAFQVNQGSSGFSLSIVVNTSAVQATSPVWRFGPAAGRRSSLRSTIGALAGCSSTLQGRHSRALTTSA